MLLSFHPGPIAPMPAQPKDGPVEIQIEEGKHYVTGGGRIVGPMRLTPKKIYRWENDAHGPYYADNGRCETGTAFDNDIVREALAYPGRKDAAERPTRQDILAKAAEAVADRGQHYGTPEDNFLRIARLWNAHVLNIGGREFQPTDVALMLDLVKTARLENDPTHTDSWIDKAGYSACGGSLA